MLSVESQVDELKKIAAQERLDIIGILTEAKSAKAPGRPIFNAMLERLHGGEAQGVLCWKLDRLARNPIDGGQINWMLQQNIIKHIQTYGRSYYPTDNVLMMSVEFGMANQFILDLSTNTKRGLRAKLEKGWLPGLAPLGYINNKYRDKGEKDIVKNEGSFPIVRKLWDMILTGQCTVVGLHKIAIEKFGLRNNRGNKPSISHFYDMFTNPFYYGLIRYKGVIYKGLHEPMVTENEFDEVQYILGNKNKPRPQKHNFAFTGAIRCGECGCMITAEKKVKYQKNGNTHHYNYYRCTKKKGSCSQKPVREKVIDDYIKTELSRIEIPQEFYEWAIGILRIDTEHERVERNTILTNQRKEYDKVVRKLETLLELRINKEITEGEFANQKTKLLNEKARLQEIINDTDCGITKWIEKAERAFSFARDARITFENGDWQAKKTILYDLGSNLSLRDGRLSISLTKPLSFIGEAAAEVKTIHERLEPLENAMDSKQLGEIYARNPVLGG